MARLSTPLSPIGFGAFKIGRNQGIKYPRGYDLPDSSEVDRLLNGVLDLGVNYIDTAPAYGLSEEHIGRALAHRRSEFFLSTKVGESFDDGVSAYDFSAASVNAGIERSLRRLRRDALDLVFVHCPRDDARVLTQTDVVSTLLSRRERGDVRSIGLSGHTIEGFEAAVPWADAFMLTYQLDDRSLEPMMTRAAEQGIAVMVKKGLASGRLSPERAITFVLRNPTVTTLLVGTLNLEHMAENLRLAEKVRREGIIPTPQKGARQDSP